MQKYNPEILDVKQMLASLTRAIEISKIQRRFYKEVVVVPPEILKSPKPVVEIEVV